MFGNDNASERPTCEPKVTQVGREEMAKVEGGVSYDYEPVTPDDSPNWICRARKLTKKKC
jgi:hypothetical protein